MRSGDRVRVTGIVSTGTSGLRILPRNKDDVVVTAINHPIDTQNVMVSPAKKPPLWGYGLVLMAAVGGYVIMQWRKNRNLKGLG
jgi:hypothetical protein